MSQIKNLARESYFLASIFSKTLILFSKTPTQHLSTFLFFYFLIELKTSL